MSAEILLQGANDGSIDKVNSSLDDNVDINSKDNGGRTALIVACGEGHLAVCQLLIDKGANLDIIDLEGNTALVTAATGEQTIYENETSLKSDAKKERLAACQLLIGKGAKIDIGNNHVIFIAASYGNLELCQLLIDKGAELNLKNKNGHTPLMRAAQNEHMKVCRLLIQKGANVNVKDPNGMTILMHTVRGWGGDNFEMCQLLVEEGADLNLTNNIGQTALMRSVYQGQMSDFLSYRVSRYLAEKGTDIEIEDDNEKTAFDLAKAGPVKEFLRNYGLVVENEERIAELEEENEELIAELEVAKAALRSDLVCVFCMDAPKSYALIPCGHKTYCMSCHTDRRVINLKMCPCCNILITGTLRVFE